MKIGNKVVSKKVTCSIAAIAVVAIMFIPVLYSFIYLKAFWDPYGSLDKVPVAFVNLDKPVAKDGKEYHIGKDVEDNLREGMKFKWDFVSYDDAKKGVEGSKYYAMIVIPEDFSQKMANAQDGKFEKGEIIYVPNKGKNYIFSQISGKAADSIKTEVESKFAEESTKESVKGTYDIKTKIGDANDGAGKLADGGNQLKDGSGKINDAIAQLNDGSKKLADGQTEYAGKMTSLAGGASQMSNGLGQLNGQIPGMVDGASKLSKGMSALNQSMPQLVDGTSQVSDGVTALKGAVGQMPEQLAAVSGGIQKGNDAIKTANKLLEEAQNDISSGNTANAAADIKKAQMILGGVMKGNSDMVNGMNASAAKLQPQLASLDKLAEGASGVANGAKATAKAVDQLNKGAGQLSAGTSQAQDAVGKLSAGAAQLADGASQASSAAGQLKDGAVQVSDGLGQLAPNESTFNKGLNDEVNGIAELKDGLGTGYNDINNKLKFTADDMGKYVSEPVVVNEKPINDVKSYGEGLAPYFIALSLWLGAMFVNLVVTVARFSEVVENKFLRSFTGKVIIGSAMVAIQAIILSFALVKGLGIDSVSVSSFYLNNIFISIVFYSVMYGLSYAIGGLATPIAFVAFILQLASCAGTFPIETAPAVYNSIGQWMPITYGVKLVRMITAGASKDMFKETMGIMLAFMAIFLVAGFAIGTMKKYMMKNKNAVAAEEQQAEAAA